jgi:hypothetical protein
MARSDSKTHRSPRTFELLATLNGDNVSRNRVSSAIAFNYQES